MGRLVPVAFLVAVALILSACQAAPTATPTKPPATPTTMPALSQPTPTKAPDAPAAPTAAAVAPTATRPPATATAVPKPSASGKVTIVYNDEVISLDHAVSQPAARAVMVSVRESLTDMDPKTFKLVGLLAESWEQTKPDTWRFKLAKGIKFHNGEAWNADAAIANITRLSDKVIGQTSVPQNSLVKQAVKVDDSTIDVITTQPDPIQPLRFAIKWEMEAPNWMKENPELIPIQAIGTGPYKFQEWVKGQYVKITADETYWGTPKPTIKDVVLVSRAEAATRAAGVKTGEFDIGSALTPELCKGIKCLTITPSDTVFIRPNTDHPVLKDKRIRQAMSFAVDRKSIVENLNSGFGVPAAQSVAAFVVGYNPNLKPDPYDPEKAKSLVAAAKADGIPVDRELQMTWLTGRFPRVSEFVEYATDAWKKVGLNVKPISRDMQGWRDAMNTKDPPDKRADLWVNNHGNETGDSGVSLMQYFTCKETRSFYCNEKVDKLYKDSTTASFDDRAKMLQEMWAIVAEDVAVVNMFHQQVLWGVTPRIKWEPRPDVLVKFKDITLTQ